MAKGPRAFFWRGLLAFLRIAASRPASRRPDASPALPRKRCRSAPSRPASGFRSSPRPPGRNRRCRSYPSCAAGWWSLGRRRSPLGCAISNDLRVALAVFLAQLGKQEIVDQPLAAMADRIPAFHDGAVFFHALLQGGLLPIRVALDLVEGRFDLRGLAKLLRQMRESQDACKRRETRPIREASTKRESPIEGAHFSLWSIDSLWFLNSFRKE